MLNDLHKELEQNGFAIIDLLQQDEIVFFNQLCDKYLHNSQLDFISSSHVLNKADSDYINQELHKIVFPKFAILFSGLQLLGGTLATKTKGKSNLEAHQDWTIVDESKYNSYNLWIPLVDTNSENGTLGLIAGSHKWNNNLRGFNIPNLYGKFTNRFLTIGTEPILKAGQAILYNHRLIHYSRPNQTNQKRNVAIIGVKDKAADLNISFSIDNKNIETYTMSESAFYQFDVHKIISNQSKIGSFYLENNKIKWGDIHSIFMRHSDQTTINISKSNKKSILRVFKDMTVRIFNKTL